MLEIRSALRCAPVGRGFSSLFAFLIAFLCVEFAVAQSARETPIGPKWWPSEWGAADERGAANRLTAEKVVEATSLIKKGKVYQLGRLYEQGMPIPGTRHLMNS